MDKIEKALEACEKVIDGIEDNTIKLNQHFYYVQKLHVLQMMKKI